MAIQRGQVADKFDDAELQRQRQIAGIIAGICTV
jgi:hypothetical protein